MEAVVKIENYVHVALNLCEFKGHMEIANTAVVKRRYASEISVIP